MITDFYLNIGEVTRLTSLSKSNIYARIRAGTFPAQTVLGFRTSRWLHSEIQDWIQAQRKAG